jgi:hypothetical protein
MDLEKLTLEKVYRKTKGCTSNYDRDYYDRNKSVSSLKQHSIEKQRRRQYSPYKSNNQPGSVGYPQDHVSQSTSRRLSQFGHKKRGDAQHYEANLPEYVKISSQQYISHRKSLYHDQSINQTIERTATIIFAGQMRKGNCCSKRLLTNCPRMIQVVRHDCLHKMWERDLI